MATKKKLDNVKVADSDHDVKAKKNTRNADPVAMQEAEARPERISVAKQRDKLSVAGQDPSRHYHWINDKDDGQRIYKLELAGYRIETDQTLTIGVKKMSDSAGLGTPHRQFAGVTRDNTTMYSYLMSTPKEFWDEDQAEKHAEIDKQMNEQTAVEEGFYDPGTKITDDTANRRY